MNSQLAPIVLFVYNRPEHTKKTIEGILSNPEAKDTELYIFADGPKPTISEECLEKLKETRAYIHQISGFKKVVIDESDKNRGLANATIRGCTKVITSFGKMIMIEDDDVPTPYFLKFMNEGLNKYENDESVWSICGFVDSKAMPYTSGDEVFFVNRPSSWGFGTWKRCWDKVIWDTETLRGIFRHKDIIRGFDKWGGRDHYHTMYNLLHGNNSSWSIRYHFAAYIHDCYSVYPYKSLIENIGLDGSGTHCGSSEMQVDKASEPIVWPIVTKFDKKKNAAYVRSFYPLNFKLRLTYFLLYHPSLHNILNRVHHLSRK